MMLLKPVSAALATAALVAGIGLGPALAAPVDWSPQQNMVNSQHYTRMLQTNRAFRQARMRKECGPITDPQLHQSCVASFNEL
jgi:hypothetical protein